MSFKNISQEEYDRLVKNFLLNKINKNLQCGH